VRLLSFFLSSCALTASFFAIASAGEGRAEAAETQLELGGAFTGFGTYMRAMPAMTLGGVDGPRQSALSGALPSVGHLTLGGASAELTLAVDRHITLPIAGLALSGAIGSSPRVLSSVDGSIVQQRPWSTYMADVLLPGIGYRIKERRWMFSAALRTGVSYAAMSGSIASGADNWATSASALSFLLRVELEGCRRLDPLERVCFAVSPSVYQFGFGNGVTAGLRWEFGP
jgi:hypothetical protein